ncbi:MAG: TetR/AcrR family transcriptional regulator [Pseudomonadota bacterium]
MTIMFLPEHRRFHMPSQSDRRKQTRHAALQAASTLIAERGYAACSIAGIANHTDFTTGAIQHHFKNKDELLAAIITEYLFENVDQDLPAAVHQQSVNHRCRYLVETMWRYYGHKDYAVAWEIILNNRSNQSLSQLIDDFFLEAEQRAGQLVQSAFSDLSITDQQAKELLLFTSAQLRGISLARFYVGSAANESAQLNYLIELLTGKLLALSNAVGEV